MSTAEKLSRSHCAAEMMLPTRVRGSIALLQSTQCANDEVKGLVGGQKLAQAMPPQTLHLCCTLDGESGSGTPLARASCGLRKAGGVRARAQDPLWFVTA